MPDLTLDNMTVTAFERNWHGSNYTVLTIRTEHGDEVEINNPPAGKGLYICPNRGDIRAYSPYAYDPDKSESVTAAQVADRLKLTDKTLWKESALPIPDPPVSVLPPGVYTFTDGNGKGGVGVAIVWVPSANGERQVQKIKSTVFEVFIGAAIPGLKSPDDVKETFGKLHHVLAEMAALYVAIEALPPGVTTTVVHDYTGVGGFMTGDWRAKGPVLWSIASASWALAGRKGLKLEFRHQPGHGSESGGRNDYVHFNNCAHDLADEAIRSSEGD